MPNRNPALRRTWNLCSLICRDRFGHTGGGGFDGSGAGRTRPLAAPTLDFREAVNVLSCQRSSAESGSDAPCHNIFQSMPYSEGDGCEFGVDSTTNVVKRASGPMRSEEHTSELQSRQYLVC